MWPRIGPIHLGPSAHVKPDRERVRDGPSQSITTVGVVEQVANVTATDELIRQTAKRSVFSAEDLTGMAPSPLSPVKMIDFLLVGHSQPPVPLVKLVSAHIFSGRPPQSITELSEERYQALKALLQLGFDV